MDMISILEKQDYTDDIFWRMYFLYVMVCILNFQSPFHQAAVAEGEAPAGLPVKKSGTAPSLTQTEVSAME